MFRFAIIQTYYNLAQFIEEFIYENEFNTLTL